MRVFVVVLESDVEFEFNDDVGLEFVDPNADSEARLRGLLSLAVPGNVGVGAVEVDYSVDRRSGRIVIDTVLQGGFSDD